MTDKEFLEAFKKEADKAIAKGLVMLKYGFPDESLVDWDKTFKKWDELENEMGKR